MDQGCDWRCFRVSSRIIGDLDADVTSVEAARSRMEFLADLQAAGYERGIGPGIYDIHSRTAARAGNGRPGPALG
jgi:methionine synthase II (cobalamin-independent)